MSYNRHSSIENNMLPWRPLGMLAFGLGVIVVFIRMHGDGYDFPVKVSQSNDSFPLPHEQRHRTDTVVLEVSVLFPEEPAVIHPEHDTTAGARFLEAEVPLEDTDYGQAGEQHEGDFNADRDGIEEHQSQLNEEDRMQQQHDGNSGSSSGYGWTSQWHLGRKRPDDQRDSWVATTPSMQKRGGEEQTWAWLTMIQHEGDRCSPGLVHQYGRPLKSILHREDNNKWRLLYTQKLPGSIIHTSVSRRLVPLSDEIKARRRSERAQDPSTARKESTLHDNAREVVRLGVVYKVVRNESASYYLRVYHFGRFQVADRLLQDDCTGQTSDCYQHDPFVFFDYELPGTMPFKDFSLEHDTIIYTRANDPYLFRYIQLPKLKVGATTPEQPYKLSNGDTGPKQACKDVLNLVYRTSAVALVPKSHPKDKRLSVLLAQVHEDSHTWTYETSISTLEANNQWTREPGTPRRPERLQETDSLYEETTTYTEPKPDPLIVRSLDGRVLYLPCKNTIQTLNPSGASRQPAATRPRQGQQQQPRPQQPPGRGIAKEYDNQSKWQHFSIDRVTFDVIDPDMGAISDDQTVMALKTKRNNVIILRQQSMRPGLEEAYSAQAWWMTMVLSDDNYLYTPAPYRYKREVRAMRILQVPKSQLRKRISESDTTKTEALAHSDDPNGQTRVHEGSGGEDPLQHIMLMAFGDGNLVVYNLDETTPSSSAWAFIQEKYQVVIGMLAVVVVFVINESR